MQSNMELVSLRDRGCNKKVAKKRGRPRKGSSAHGAKKARLANERWDALGRRAREVRREGKGRNAANLDADQKALALRPRPRPRRGRR